MELEAEALHLRPVVLSRRNRRRMSAALKFQRQRETGMKIAKRSDSREQNSLRLSFACQSGLRGKLPTGFIRRKSAEDSKVHRRSCSFLLVVLKQLGKLLFERLGKDIGNGETKRPGERVHPRYHVFRFQFAWVCP